MNTTDNVMPTAIAQTSLSLDDIFHSANAGVIVHRTAIAKARFRSEARIFARELAEYINESQKGVASAFVYEETFGTKDVIHWFININNLEDYPAMVTMGSTDSNFRDIILKERISPEKGGGAWDRIFIDGNIREQVLLPQFNGMYGTNEAENNIKLERTKRGGFILPPAQHQSCLPPEQTLNSVTCGILIHRTAQVKYEFRGQGRVFARDVANSINLHMKGHASALFYEEAFGRSDRVHWLIHLKDLATYYALIEMHANLIPEVRDIYTKQWVPEDQGGPGWGYLFMNGTLEDLALTPQHWNMYATVVDK